MSQHTKKETSASHANSTRQRKQDDNSSKSQKKLAPNGNANGNGNGNGNGRSSDSSSNSNSNTSFTISSSASASGSSINKMQNVATKASKKDKQLKDKERNERAQLVLWRRPLQTSKYCGLELIALLRTWSSR